VSRRPVYDPRVPARRPILIMALSAVAFALMAFTAKLASARLSGSEIAFFRFAFMLLPLVAVPRLARSAIEYQRLDVLVYRGVFGGLAVLLYFLTIAHIPVGIATLLNYSSPVWSVPFAALFLGERVDRRLLLPLVLALTGLALASTGGRASTLLHPGVWEWTGLGSSIFAGAALTATRAARRTESSWSVYASFSLCGFLATAPFALASFRRPTPHEWLLLALVGASAVAAQLLMTWAYRWVTNLQAGVISELAVVTSMLLGVVFLGDRLTPLQVWGSVLALVGVAGVAWSQSTPRAVE
jgi:drug/metabolite transporter (DMT)-like permease